MVRAAGPEGPGTMTGAPAWTEEPGGWAHTLVRGDIRGRVWRRLGIWEAIVRQHGGFCSAGDFTTAEDAQAWCEERSAERSAGT